jgi:hypothetical protein
VQITKYETVTLLAEGRLESIVLERTNSMQGFKYYSGNGSFSVSFDNSKELNAFIKLLNLANSRKLQDAESRELSGATSASRYDLDDDDL